jgi:MFS family permease
MKWGINSMFYTSAILAVVSMAILWNLPETLHKRRRFEWQHLKVGRSDIFDPLVLPVAITMILCYASYGVIITLIPDMSDRLGVENRGTCFSIFTLASVLTRFSAGRISDQMGRVPVLRASAIAIAIAMSAFALAETKVMLFIAAAVFGLANGIFSPAINAWAVDLGEPGKKGRALATMYISLEIAIGGGALLSGWYIANHFERMPAVFWTTALLSLAGWVYLFRLGTGKDVSLKSG